MKLALALAHADERPIILANNCMLVGLKGAAHGTFRNKFNDKFIGTATHGIGNPVFQKIPLSHQLETHLEWMLGLVEALETRSLRNPLHVGCASDNLYSAR